MKKLFLIIFLSGFTFSQNTFEFLRIDMSPRASALGGSFIAAHDDPDVIFYNPAGLKLLEETPMSLSFVKHLMDFNLASFSISKELFDGHRFGLGIKYINYGTFTEADEFGNKTGEFGAGEFALLLGYSGELDNNFYYGTNVSFIYSGIAEYSSTGLAADLGLLYTIPDERWAFAFSISNVGTQLSSYGSIKEDLPFTVNFGATKKLLHLPLRLFIDFKKLNKSSDSFTDRFNAFSVGGEFTLSKVLTLRLGYENEKRKDLKVGTFAGLAGFNLGVGIKIKEYLFNYSYSSFGEIGALHRIGLSGSL